jgi:hypothetical protein
MSLPINSPVIEMLQQASIPYDVIEIPLTEDKKTCSESGGIAFEARYRSKISCEKRVV